MSGKDRGQKAVKKPAKQTLKEKRAVKRGKSDSNKAELNRRS